MELKPSPCPCPYPPCPACPPYLACPPDRLVHVTVNTQIYIFHIYTRPKFTDPTFTLNPDLHKPKFTQLRFKQNQIYTALHCHTHIYTTQIYTKLNPNLHRLVGRIYRLYIDCFEGTVDPINAIFSETTWYKDSRNDV